MAEALPVEQADKVSVITLQDRSVWCAFVSRPFYLIPEANIAEFLGSAS